MLQGMVPDKAKSYYFFYASVPLELRCIRGTTQHDESDILHDLLHAPFESFFDEMARVFQPADQICKRMDLCV